MNMYDMTLQATCLFLVLAGLTSAHMVCPTCIPLEDLLAPGYGISVSVNGLSSAIAYHNGTIVTLASMVGSDEYRNLMSSTIEQHDTYEPRWTALDCPARLWEGETEPWDKDILKLMHSYAEGLMERIKGTFSPSNTSELTPPLDPTEKMLQAQLLALEPFASMSAESRKQVAVAIQLPAWFVASPYACSFREVAEGIFGRVVALESAASSAYTALGHDLCRVSQEAYECCGPGRLAIFEYDGHFATASIVKTPLLHIFDDLGMRYSTLVSNDSAELSKWIDSFLDAYPADMIALAGSHVNSRIFQEALSLLNIASRVERNDAVEAEDILVKGAAQAAKDILEDHNTDCGEFPECLRVRHEADRIAGEYMFPTPKVWPAVSNRRWRWNSDPEVDPYLIYKDNRWVMKE